MNQPQPQNCDAPKDVLEIGSLLGVPHLVEDNSIPYIVLPERYVAHDLERLLPAPTRIRRTVELSDLDSFVDYVNRFRNEATTIYRSGLDFGAILDHSAKDEPAWHEHKAVLKLRHSADSAGFLSNDGRQFSQNDFAEFIEDRVNLFCRPAGVEMFELASTFKANESVEFQRAIRLTNGDTKLKYNVTTSASAGASEEIEIPRDFVVCVPYFFGDEPTHIVARLRYRINSGSLVFSFHINDKENLQERQLSSVSERIEARTGIRPLIGCIR